MSAQRQPLGTDSWTGPTSPGIGPTEIGKRKPYAGYIAAIVVNVILLYIAHNLLDWRVPFLTPAFADVLWAINLSLSATIVANLVYLVYDASWLKSIIQVALNAIAFGVTAILYARFPFDFATVGLNQLVHFALLLVMVALVIATVVQAIVFLVDLLRQQG